MAQTEHLPIYRASYDLCLYLEQVVRGFSRYHKYTLGADLRDGARRVLKLLVRANARRDKVAVLLEVREEVEQLKVVLRLCQDVKAFASFFPSIHKETLYAILARHLHDPELRWLTRVVLFQDPTTSYRFRSRRRGVPPPGTPGYPVAAAKSLFGKANARGLPIGNLTSQFWANVYLNELDQFVKRQLRCRYYVRYVDDLVLLANDPAELVRARDAIATFLREHLKLALRAGPAEPFPVGYGIDFVGWRTWGDRRLVRRRTVGNLAMRLDAFARAAVRPVHDGAARRIALGTPRAAARVERLRAALASYSGHLRHGAAFGDWDRVWRRYRWLGALFARRGWQVAARWPPARLARAERFAEQYWQLVRRAGPRCLVFCQVGRYVEIRGPQRPTAERVLGLRCAQLPRAGYGLAVGFPGWLTRRYEARALAQGHAVAIVRETGARLGRCRERRPVALLVPVAGRAGLGHASVVGPFARPAVARARCGGRRRVHLGRERATGLQPR